MKYIFANWKMYLGVKDTLLLAEQIAPLVFQHHVAVFPNHLVFSSVDEILKSNTNISCGAQNIAWTPQGAYTGAISAQLYQEAGARYALVGHSERRYIFGETDSDVRKKVEACLAAKIIPIVCIGETREDKEKNTRALRLKEQIKAVFEGLSFENQEIFIAYEPVWAISRGATSDPCMPADVEDAHQFIRQEIALYTDCNLPILYGGSVNAQNIVSYISLPMVDGVLVGNASTKNEFWQFVSQL